MEKKRTLILGAGISGLSAAWYLSRNNTDMDCVLIEKGSSYGGWMGTEKRGDFLLEKGPRIFKTSRNDEFLQIIQEIGFFSSLIPSSSKAKSRYLWIDQKMQKMPDNPFSLLFSTLGRSLVSSLWKERKVPVNVEDETVWGFACRRFGRNVADHFFDALVLGIYAGDAKNLSVEACFPILKKWEKEKGSVIKGAISSIKNRKKMSFPASLFSFPEGSLSFLDHWVKQIPYPIHLNEEACFIQKKEDKWYVKTSKNEWEADHLILALPAFTASKLLESIAPKTACLLSSILYQDVTNIQMGWKDQDVLPFSAFGYLVPTNQNEPVLGTLFDSKMFDRKDSQITCMIRGSSHTEDHLEKIAQGVLERHLQISEKPDLCFFRKIPQAIPQYTLGHLRRKKDIYESLVKEAPNIHLVGNYLEGVSVNDCIKNSKEVASKLF